MVGDTNRLALQDAEAFSEPRKIESGLLMAMALLVAGGVLGGLFLLGDDIQRSAGTIRTVYAGTPQPTSCGPEALPMNAQGVAAGMASPPSVVAKPAGAEFRPQAAVAGANAGRAGTTVRSASSAARGSKPSPSYIRRPAPEPASAKPALEALRRSL